MATEADLILKGQVIATTPRTNSSLPYWGKPHATTIHLISLLKGHSSTNDLIFWHNTSGPDAWGGGDPPSWHQFEVGKSYLLFANKLDQPGYLYTPPPDATNRPSEFRQLDHDGVTSALDTRPLTTVSVKEAHWLELNLLLKDTNPTNQAYAISKLDTLSLAGRAYDQWAHSDDFKRDAVLQAVVPLVTNHNEQVAATAIGCYAVGGCSLMLLPDSHSMPVVRGYSEVKPECIVQVSPFSYALVEAADSSASSRCRAAAIAALSCTRFALVSNSLPRWLKDPSEVVRAQAVLVLPDFPGEFCEGALWERASDSSPVVRAAVADAIGIGQIKALVPTLAALFSSSPVRTNSGPWPHKDLQGDGYATELGTDDIHSSAGYALLRFDWEQVGGILKTNLSDTGFGLSFIRKLAASGVEPYLPLLAEEFKEHTAGSEQEAAKNGFHWPLSYWLVGDYGWAWETMFGYVSEQTREALAAPPMVPILDALQIADDPGDSRTRSLYGFFLDNGMIERATALRRGIIRRTEDKAIDKNSFNFPALIKAFDDLDEKHSLKPGRKLGSPQY